MPISKNRKGHAKKAAMRKTKKQQDKNRLEKMYREMLEQLKDKNSSMTEMLNKEETTTNATTDEYTVVDAPIQDLSEPVSIPFSQVVEYLPNEQTQ